MYDRNTTHWESADGSLYIIKDLEISHLVNILNWVKQHPKNYGFGLFSFLEEEAKLRKMIAFSENTPYPFKLESGFYKLVNISKFRAVINRIKLGYYRYIIRKNTKKKG